MTQNSRRFFLIASLLLCFVLIFVLLVFGSMAPMLRLLFVPYQYFLIGICVGALILATIGLIVERGQWTHYGTYFTTVMLSVFVLVVINSVIFRVLGGEQFVRKLIEIFRVVFIGP
jgi:hypothetical protein